MHTLLYGIYRMFTILFLCWFTTSYCMRWNNLTENQMFTRMFSLTFIWQKKLPYALGLKWWILLCLVANSYMHYSLLSSCSVLWMDSLSVTRRSAGRPACRAETGQRLEDSAVSHCERCPHRSSGTCTLSHMVSSQPHQWTKNFSSSHNRLLFISQ